MKSAAVGNWIPNATTTRRRLERGFVRRKWLN